MLDEERLEDGFGRRGVVPRYGPLQETATAREVADDEDCPRAVRRDWSAETIAVDDRVQVLMNPAHDPQRQPVTLMEELGHILLGHRPSRLYQCLTPLGRNSWQGWYARRDSNPRPAV